MKVLTSFFISSLFTLSLFAGQNVTASFKADKQEGELPLSVTFKGLDDKPGVQYKWDFGNGSTSLRKETTTMFVNPGTYQVKLVVNNGTETDSSYMSIKVFPNPDMMQKYRPEKISMSE